MNKQLLLKIKEALVSVLPITLFVIILNFTPIINFSQKEMLVFVFSSSTIHFAYRVISSVGV